MCGDTRKFDSIGNMEIRPKRDYRLCGEDERDRSWNLRRFNIRKWSKQFARDPEKSLFPATLVTRISFFVDFRWCVSPYFFFPSLFRAVRSTALPLRSVSPEFPCNFLRRTTCIQDKRTFSSASSYAISSAVQTKRDYAGVTKGLLKQSTQVN